MKKREGDYKPEEIEYLREISHGKTNREITELFNKKFNQNRTRSGIVTIKTRNGIKTGSNGLFEKGHTSPIRLPVGAERKRSGYIYVKVGQPSAWKPKHYLIWEKYNGKVPAGHILVFGDGNKNNYELDNIILMSKNEGLRMNYSKLIQNNAEGTKGMLNIVRIQKKIYELEKVLNKK